MSVRGANCVGCTDTSRSITSSPNNIFALTTWVHVVATINGNTMSMYNNGILAMTGMSADTPTTMTRLYHYLGQSEWSADGYFAGTIGYFRVWNGLALSATEAASLYSMRLNCPATGNRIVSGGTCAGCPAGQYLATQSSKSCTNCPAGKYNPSTSTVGISSCIYCPPAKSTSIAGLNACVTTPTHEWDFRGCTVGATVIDSYSTLLATPSASGTTCSAYGMVFSGSSSFVTLDNWLWGGDTSFEVYAQYTKFNSFASIFCSGNAGSDNNVNFGNYGATATGYLAGKPEHVA